jgi:hypothetical protein
MENPFYSLHPAVLVYSHLNLGAGLSFITSCKSHHCYACRHLESHYFVPHTRFDAHIFIPRTFRVPRAGGHAAQPSVALDGNAILGAHTAWFK